MKNTISLLNIGRIICVIFKILLVFECIACLVMAIVFTVLGGPVYLAYLAGIPASIPFVLFFNYLQHLFEGSASEFMKLDNYVSALYIDVANTKEKINAIKEKTVTPEPTIDEPEPEVVLKEEPKEKVVDDYKDEIGLDDKVIILNDVYAGSKVFKANSVGIVDNILMSIGGKSYVVILDNDPDKTEINLRREEIKKIK